MLQEISIEQIEKKIVKILQKAQFPEEEIGYMCKIFLDAELSKKTTHGLNACLRLATYSDKNKINRSGEDIELLNETSSSFLVDGKRKTGFYVLSKALEIGIKKAKDSGIVAVGLTNTAPTTGHMSYYANLAAEKNLIFISGTSTDIPRLVPYGTTTPLWGTNPLTIGMPSKGSPVILDMSTTKKSAAYLVEQKNKNEKLPLGIAVDKNGKETTNPEEALQGGGIYPIASHKGSGLAFLIELLTGALTGSSIGKDVEGGWGTFFILLKADIFRTLDLVNNDVSTAINELKSARKANPKEEIYYPGENSQRNKQESLDRGTVFVADGLLENVDRYLIS